MAKKTSGSASGKSKPHTAKKETSSKGNAENENENSVKAQAKSSENKAAENKATGPKQNQSISFNSPAGNILVIRLFIKNRHLTPLLARLSVDDWVSADGHIYPTYNRIEPGYLYILQEGEAAATISLLLPDELQEGHKLTSNLRFPGSNEQPLPLEVAITSGKKEPGNSPLEKSVNISLPFEKIKDKKTRENEKTSAAIFHMVSGLANLSALPSQWLFAEGLVMICMEGERYSKEEEGEQLLKKITQTRFFKNLTLAFATGRLPQWVSGSILSSSSLHAAMGGQFGQGRIIYIWLKWLLSLIDSDIEDGDQEVKELNFPPANLEEAVSRYGSESQLWAAYLLLGLTRISPQLNQIMRSISKNISEENDNGDDNSGEKADDILNEPGSMSR